MINTKVNLEKLEKELKKEKELRASISKLTHELKNPIAVCKGYLEMIDLSDLKKTKKYITIITEEINRSKNIIEEFSDYGKLKKLNKEEIEVSVLLEDVVDILKPLFSINYAKLKVINKEELYIKADYNKLKQVLINLLKNALEAKRQARRLYVELELKENEKSIIIIIKDNGIGMSKDTLDKVYNIFYTTKEKGTGLGLTFCKEVIELHNGTIKIYSKEQIGTKVVIELPKEKKSEDFNNKNY